MKIKEHSRQVRGKVVKKFHAGSYQSLENLKQHCSVHDPKIEQVRQQQTYEAMILPKLTGKWIMSQRSNIEGRSNSGAVAEIQRSGGAIFGQE